MKKTKTTIGESVEGNSVITIEINKNLFGPTFAMREKKGSMVFICTEKEQIKMIRDSFLQIAKELGKQI